MRSPLYWSGHVYHAGIKLMHGKALKDRYRYIANFSGDSVIDVGCGTGMLADYLPKDNEYLGIDLNENFLRLARKHGRNVMRQDALTFDRFDEFDCCVIMDLLHHINPRHEEFLERVMRDIRKRVIICEPFEIPSRDPITRKLNQIIDNDGTNKPEEWMKKEELREFYEGYNPRFMKEFGKAVIAVYDK